MRYTIDTDAKKIILQTPVSFRDIKKIKDLLGDDSDDYLVEGEKVVEKEPQYLSIWPSGTWPYGSNPSPWLLNSYTPLLGTITCTHHCGTELPLIQEAIN